ncbi:hypothetical protein P0082_01455 [Candidatus Haliotispira prima]|uniref:TPM domain-containing protein n=1 Tax=Candidatus Haliotispira prima TaxID=3034016 RepID=A0ABY8MJL0_9SPIO|nr:hypothetical protein P0082_01455 [Candidatus Haliotispira prima]
MKSNLGIMGMKGAGTALRLMAILAFTGLCLNLLLSPLVARGSSGSSSESEEEKGAPELVAFVSDSNAGFDKDVRKNLNSDSRKYSMPVQIEKLDGLLNSDLGLYKKVAIIAYISDIEGDILGKILELQGSEPDKYELWLTYTGSDAPALPEGIDAATSASKQSYSEYGYGQNIVPHLFQ